MATDLYTVTTERDLNVFLSDHIQPDSRFHESCNAIINRLVHFLQNNLPGKLRPRRVLKAGSLGKGTAVKDRSDIDLVLMLSSYTDVEALMRDMEKLLKELNTYLVQFHEATHLRVTPFSVQVKLVGGGIEQSVDILPAVDLLGRGGVPAAIYHRMGRPDANLHEYSVTLGPMQVEIIGALPAKVKDIIRMVKYWEDEKMKKVYNAKWPSSFTMELVILHAWNEARCPESFSIVRALHAVLVLLVNHRNFQITFPKQMQYSKDLLKRRDPPYMMDPTNPYNDMYNGLFGTPWDWDEVAKVARSWLSNPLFHNVRNSEHQWQIAYY